MAQSPAPQQNPNPEIEVPLESGLAEPHCCRKSLISHPKISKPFLGSVFALCLLCLVTAEIYFGTYSVFQEYDDMGYLMVSAKEYQAGKPLYDVVFSQYGPFYYLTRSMVYGSAKITHDWTALVSIGHAVFCIAVLTLASWRITRQWWASLLTLGLCGFVSAFANEPGHPQELVSSLIAALALVLAVRSRSASMALVSGLIVGAIAMTKVNVGVFVLLALCSRWICELPQNLIGRWLFLGWLVAVASFPFFLLRAHLGTQWGLSLGVIIVSSILPLLLIGRLPRKTTCWKELAALLGGCLIMIAFVVCQQLASGTTLHGLLDGLLIQPAKFAGEFSVAFPCGYRHAAWALVAFMGALIANRWATPRVLKILAFCYTAGLIVLLFKQSTYGMVKVFAPLAWVPLLCAIRVNNQAAADHDEDELGISSQGLRSDFPVRLLFALLILSAFLALQAYPVAGSQVACALMLLPVILPVIMVMILPRVIPVLRWQFAFLVVLVLFLHRGARFYSAWARYGHNVRTELHGMTRFRLPEEQVLNLEWAARQLHNYNTFISLPGLNSFYFWAEKDPPTAMNATAWMILFSDQRQRGIIARCREYEHIAVLRAPALENFWGPYGRKSPLVQFIESGKVTASRGPFQIIELNTNER